MTSATDDALLRQFDTWLRDARGLRGNTTLNYLRTARRILELVPRDAWEGIDATRPAVESFSLSQRTVARSGARRFAEYLKEVHSIALTHPTGPSRGGMRRVPPSSVILALGYLVDRTAPSTICMLTWEHPNMDGSIRLPGGGVIPPHPETMFALAELSAWRPAHASTDALVPSKSGGGAPPVPLAQLRRWLQYKGEAQADATAAAKLRAAFTDPSTLRFPCFSRGTATPRPTPHPDDMLPIPLAEELGICEIPSPTRGSSLPDLDTATSHVNGEG